MILYMGKYTRKRRSKRRSKRKQKGSANGKRSWDSTRRKKKAEDMTLVARAFKAANTLQNPDIINRIYEESHPAEVLAEKGAKERAEKVRDDKVLIAKAFGAANARDEPDIIDRLYQTSRSSLPRDIATELRPAAERANRRRTTWRRQASVYTPQNRYIEDDINPPLVPRRQAADNPHIRRGTQQWVYRYPSVLPPNPKHWGFTQADVHESARYPMFGPQLRVVDEFTNQGGRKTKKLR